MDDLALFDVTPVDRPPNPPKLDADAARTKRQREAIDGGWHPLTPARNTIRIKLHADATRARTADERDLPGLRCGDCRFRVLFGYRRSYPKCLYPGERPPTGYPRLTHGPGTDVRAWWPACVDYRPKEAS